MKPATSALEALLMGTHVDPFALLGIHAQGLAFQNEKAYKSLERIMKEATSQRAVRTRDVRRLSRLQDNFANLRGIVEASSG